MEEPTHTTKYESDSFASGTRPIHQLQRQVKQQENTLYNSLCSIHEDRRFVEKITRLYPSLPILANLRCGTWYCPRIDSTCYFKSTDGHTNNWTFSLRRLNAHVAWNALDSGGCMIVDATRKGKVFPDSMRKTIPIWCCVLNRYVQKIREKVAPVSSLEPNEGLPWDVEFYAHSSVSASERHIVSKIIDKWVQELIDSKIDLARLVSDLEKPFRVMWISQTSKIWTKEIVPPTGLPFTPIICISASYPTSAPIVKGLWTYVQGAADDEENIMNGLTHDMFARCDEEILESGKDNCLQKVLEVVQRERNKILQRVQGEEKERHEVTPNTHKEESHSNAVFFHHINFLTDNIAVGSIEGLSEIRKFNGIVNLSQYSINTPGAEQLHIPLTAGKLEKHGLEFHLLEIIPFVKKYAPSEMKVLIICEEGTDRSPAVALACLVAIYDASMDLYTKELHQDIVEGKGNKTITKESIKQSLFFLMQKHPQASISRNHLQQLNRFFLSPRHLMFKKKTNE